MAKKEHEPPEIVPKESPPSDVPVVVNFAKAVPDLDAEEIAKAKLIAEAEAEAQVIKAVRAEMDAKKNRREEARLAKRMSATNDAKQGRTQAKLGRTPPAKNVQEQVRGRTPPAKNVQERVRGLTAPEQQKLARTGDQRERVALERLCGKTIWEALLRNPKLTAPEVARIARMGSLPVPMIEIIVANRSWLSAPQVRRALFTNPRLKNEALMTVLRATPKAELKLMPKQMAYPALVRQAAKRLMR